MKSSRIAFNRKLVALVIALMMITTQFAGMTVFAEYMSIIPSGDPGYCEIRISMPDNNVPEADWALCKGAPTSYSYGTVNTFKNNNTISAYTPLSGGRVRIYEVMQPGLYSVVVLTTEYYDVVQMFNVTQEMIHSFNMGADLEIEVRTGPRTWKGWEPNRIVNAASGRDRGLSEDGELLPFPQFASDSRDQIMFVYPDEVYEKWFAPEATNPDARFPYPAGGFQTPMFTQRDEMGMWQVTTQNQLMNFMQDEYDNFVQGTNDVYAYYEVVGKSGHYEFELPLVVFAKQDISEEEEEEGNTPISECTTMDEVGKILQASGKPTVWHQAQIHANEQGSGEGAIALIQELYGDYGDEILEDINVVVVPRINVDGSRNHQRETTVTTDPYLSVDMNRDHMKMDAVELYWLHKAFYKVLPEVVIDGHEFDIYDGMNADGTIRGSWPLDDLMPVVSTGLNNGDDINRLNKELNMAVIENARDAGIRIAHYQGTKCPALSRAYFGLSGSLSILFEGKGLGGGASHMERRAYTQYTSAKAVYAYAAENAEELLAETKAMRDELIQTGTVYDSESKFVLRQSAASDVQFYTKPMGPHPGLNIITNSVVGTLEADGPFDRNWSDYSWTGSNLRTRSRPTAYVIPLDKIQNLAKFQWTLDGHSIEYFKTPEGLKIDNLQQYYWISGTITASSNPSVADLRDEASATFENGAIVVPLDQPQANIISSFFEPDYNDSDSYTVNAIQMGFIARDGDNNYPIYRYIGDYPRVNIPNENSLKLTTNAHLVKAGDNVVLNAGFYQEQSSNTAFLNFTFEGDKFEYVAFTPASGVIVIGEDSGDGWAEIKVFSPAYDMKDFGEIVLRAKDDAEFVKGYQTVGLEADFVLKHEDDSKETKNGSTTASFTVIGQGDLAFDLITLSDMIDWIGITKEDSTALWEELFMWYDFNGNDEIDIQDIAFVARLLVA